ncbi:hypothetical protein [Mycobacterium leprae]|uniref:hypothetical protein n=1 Tax=Mycobacterium leprae TaxID=1769 RepID=UPI00030F8626|nr:hypothetical protein [Mycobacterium leprae]
MFLLIPPQYTLISWIELFDWLSVSLICYIGPGVEYAGDQLLSVKWSVSVRRGQLYVTQRFTDCAANVVVLIDMYR